MASADKACGAAPLDCGPKQAICAPDEAWIWWLRIFWHVGSWLACFHTWALAPAAVTSRAMRLSENNRNDLAGFSVRDIKSSCFLTRTSKTKCGLLSFAVMVVISYASKVTSDAA